MTAAWVTEHLTGGVAPVPKRIAARGRFNGRGLGPEWLSNFQGRSDYSRTRLFERGTHQVAKEPPKWALQLGSGGLARCEAWICLAARSIHSALGLWCGGTS